MDIVDLAFKPLRAVVGATEHEVERTLPVKDIEGIQAQILEGVGALGRATESIESHVEVVDTLASSLPELTAAVNALSIAARASSSRFSPRWPPRTKKSMHAEAHVEHAEEHVANVEHGSRGSAASSAAGAQQAAGRRSRTGRRLPRA